MKYKCCRSAYQPLNTLWSWRSYLTWILETLWQGHTTTKNQSITSFHPTQDNNLKATNQIFFQILKYKIYTFNLWFEIQNSISWQQEIDVKKRPDSKSGWVSSSKSNIGATHRELTAKADEHIPEIRMEERKEVTQKQTCIFQQVKKRKETSQLRQSSQWVTQTAGLNNKLPHWRSTNQTSKFSTSSVRENWFPSISKWYSIPN